LARRLGGPQSESNIIRIMKSKGLRFAGHVARIGRKRDGYIILVGNTEEKRPLGRPRRRWEDNIKIDGVVWIGLIWFRIGTIGGPLLTRQ
jgi:hypothetical protein